MKTSVKSTRRSTRKRFPDAGGGILAVLAENMPSPANCDEQDPSVSVPTKKTTTKKKRGTQKTVVFSPAKIIQRKIQIDDEDDDAVSELTSDLGSTLQSAVSSQLTVTSNPSSVIESEKEDDSEQTESEREGEIEDEGDSDEEVSSDDDDEEESCEISDNDDDTEAEDDSVNGDDLEKVSAWKEKKKIKVGDDNDENVDDIDSEMEYDNDDEYEPDDDETEFEEAEDSEEDSDELELDDDDLRITQKRSTVPLELSVTKSSCTTKHPAQSSNVEEDESESGGYILNQKREKEPESEDSEDAIEDDDTSQTNSETAPCTKKDAHLEDLTKTFRGKMNNTTFRAKSVSQCIKEDSDDESIVTAEIIDDESLSDGDSILEAEVEADEPIVSPKSNSNTTSRPETKGIAPPIAESMQKSTELREQEKISRENNFCEQDELMTEIHSSHISDDLGKEVSTTEKFSGTNTTDKSDTEDDFVANNIEDDDSMQEFFTNSSDEIPEAVLNNGDDCVGDDEHSAHLKINESPENSLVSNLHQKSVLDTNNPVSRGPVENNVTRRLPLIEKSNDIGDPSLKHSLSIDVVPGNRFQSREDNRPMQEEPVDSVKESAKIMAQVNLFKNKPSAENKLETGLSMKKTIDLEDVPQKSRHLGNFFQRTRSEGTVKQGQWTIGSRIGTGSFGVVHVGMNHRNGSLMAVKSIPMQPAIMKDIRREIDLLKTLDHTNIVRYYGAEISGPNLHIFQEWVAGGSVSDLLSKFGPFPFPVIQSYAEQTLQGLAYLHANNILHRDIKGSNLLVSDEGIVKLADFGGSRKMTEFHSDMMMSMTIRGTPYFMAPEVFEEKYSSKADIWAVGCVIYQMTTACPPWKNLGFNNPFSLCRHLQTTVGPPPLPRTLPASDGNQLNNFLGLLGRCFCRTPYERPCVTALLQDPFFLEKGYWSDDDHSVGPGLFSPEVIRTRERLASPPLSVKMTGKSIASPVCNASSNTPPRPRRNSIGTPRSPFLSPPLPKRTAEKNNRTTVLYSPAKDTSEWPNWAIKKYHERSVENGLTSMMDSLALSSDSSCHQFDSLVQTSSIKGLEFLPE